jgi:hypothetical protein
MGMPVIISSFTVLRQRWKKWWVYCTVSFNGQDSWSEFTKNHCATVKQVCEEPIHQTNWIVVISDKNKNIPVPVVHHEVSATSHVSFDWFLSELKSNYHGSLMPNHDNSEMEWNQNHTSTLLVQYKYGYLCKNTPHLNLGFDTVGGGGMDGISPPSTWVFWEFFFWLWKFNNLCN